MNLRLALVAVASIAIVNSASASESCDGRTCSATNTVQVHVGTVLRLGLPAVRSSAGPVANVRSNGAWRLEVKKFTATNTETVQLTLVGA